jgi:hypothetical protein
MELVFFQNLSMKIVGEYNFFTDRMVTV